jgi:hypothetical protein
LPALLDVERDPEATPLNWPNERDPDDLPEAWAALMNTQKVVRKTTVRLLLKEVIIKKRKKKGQQRQNEKEDDVAAVRTEAVAQGKEARHNFRRR